MDADGVLVTGGAGFIGSYLAERLVAEGQAVTVLDDLSTGSLDNLSGLIDRPGFAFVRGSVVDPEVVDPLAARHGTVVHLAAAVGVRLIMQQPLQSFITNVRGTEVVLEAAHRHQRPVFVASTSEIYGKNQEVLTEESDRIVGPPSVTRWAYSSAKAADEFLAFAYHRERALPVVVGRFFNTVGPRQSPAYGMVIPRFVRQALAGEPVTVYGDGSQRRCFCHVLDTVDAVVRMLREPAANGEAFNIGGAEEITIGDLAERVVAKVGSGSEIRRVDYRSAYPEPGFEDPRRRRPDTTKLRSLVGWRPARDLETILEETIEYERARLAGAPG